MELVLEGSERVPEGSVLSIKVGETRRQAPISKLGQSFKFSTSVAAALPVKIEVLVPAAAPQSIMLDPLKPRFEIDLGGNMKIKMRQQAVEEYQRSVPDVGQIADSKGLDGEKKDMAKTAGAYLEKHGLVRTLQDLLHGLLVTRPDDPWSYLDEHLSRAKSLATGIEAPPPTKTASTAAQQYAPSQPLREAPPPPPPQAQANAQPGLVKEKSSRGAINRSRSTSASKVDALMDILVKTQQNLPLILPCLPMEMGDMLVSSELADECRRQFAELDKERKGCLGPEALLPVIVQLSTANKASVNEDQCRKFVDLFDANEDGSIDVNEFTSLTQFVIIAAHLESDEGKDLLNKVQGEEARFTDFIDVLMKDKDRINDIVPFLPDHLVQHLTSDEFLDDCMKEFDKLDVDNSDSLEPQELIPVVLSLSKLQSDALNIERCRQFVDVFDVLGNGCIMREEFLEFAQFLAVMNFLATSTEGQQISEAAGHQSEQNKTDQLIMALEEDISTLPEVISYLPKTMSDELNSDAFRKECSAGFKKLDANGNNVLDPAELFPLIIQLCEGHPVDVDDQVCKKFTAIFDKDRNGVISIDEFVTLSQFIITMAYLTFTQEWRDAEVTHSRKKIESLLKLMKEHCDRLDEVLRLLPDELQEDLMGDTFTEDCLVYFDELDTDRSGALEPKELVPVVLDLCSAHPFALTTDQCLRFVDIFDTERTGVLSRNEFVNFARFMMIMSYLETEEGKVVSDFADIAKGEKQVEEYLFMLEKDRNSVSKIIPMLPEYFYEALTSDDFVNLCHDKFMELDADGNGTLSPEELFPLIVELSSAHPYSVDLQQCERFTAIFDIRGDGVIRLDEFVDFARFLEIMSYLQSDEGKQEFAEGLKVLDDAKQIEDLITMLQNDRRQIKMVIPYLPDDLREELLSEHFTLNCLERFQQLDADSSGSLDPSELYPIIMDMTSAHHLALDIEQCKRFTDVFDDAQTGVISQKEFVNFARFLVVMAFLQTEDGQTTLDIALQQEESKMRPAQLAVTGQSVGPGSSLNSPQAVGHLSVDLEFYQEKSEKLKKENSGQRKQLLDMEEKMRKMEERMELQERKLRHASVDLNATN